MKDEISKKRIEKRKALQERLAQLTKEGADFVSEDKIEFAIEAFNKARKLV